jgi:hypothetical protein
VSRAAVTYILQTTSSGLIALAKRDWKCVRPCARGRETIFYVTIIHTDIFRSAHCLRMESFLLSVRENCGGRQTRERKKDRKRGKGKNGMPMRSAKTSSKSYPCLEENKRVLWFVQKFNLMEIINQIYIFEGLKMRKLDILDFLNHLFVYFLESIFSKI